MTTNTEIKTLDQRIKPGAWLMKGETGNILAASMAEAAELRAALEAKQQALEAAQRVAQRAGSCAQQPQDQFRHYDLSAEQVQQLLAGGLKPEEISGADDVQHDRVHELVWWFARLTQGNANPKWAVRHACELAYFIATNGINRNVDLKAVRDAAFKEGVNITPEERGTLECIGFATSRPAAPPAAAQPEDDNVDSPSHPRLVAGFKAGHQAGRRRGEQPDVPAASGESPCIEDRDGIPAAIRMVIQTRGSFDALRGLYRLINIWGNEQRADATRKQPDSGRDAALLKDARHRIANLSRAAVPFNDPLDGPVLLRLDAAIAAMAAQQGEQAPDAK